MRAEVHFTAHAIEASAVQHATVVVVDVLRATSTMVEALANGARAIYPAAEAEEAIKLATSLGREDTLLCGERRGLKIEGYDLGNSPGEFTPERVADKPLVMSTTNGTRAFLAVAGAARVVAGSFLNLDAVADAVAAAEELAVVCAGREGRFSLDDAVCAGMLLRRVRSRVGDLRVVGDGARTALTLADSVRVDASFLAGTEAGAALVEIGMESDLALCADVDRHDLVPVMHDRMIRVRDRD